MTNIFTHGSKNILIGLVILSFSFVANAQNVTIPDANFKFALVNDAAINTNLDTEIQVSEAAAFSGTINVDNLGINDLTGIETFTALSQLICSNNSLTSIDVSANIGLTHFDCRYNQLANLDVIANTLLYEFRCSYNQITALDVSNCLGLFLFACGNNQLTTINVSYNTLLEGFFCFDNLLTNLDVSAIPLVQFWCYGNQLSSLDVSDNPNLFTLQCGSNLLTSLDLSANTALGELGFGNNPIANLNLSQNSVLATIICANMASLISLNIQNGNNANLVDFTAINNPNLTCVQVDDIADMNTNWSSAIDATASYSLLCNPCAALPTPQFNINNNNISAAPATAIFTNSTSNMGLYDFLWHFGDGGAINDDNATVNYTYNTNGNFEVSLTLIDPVSGCSISNYNPSNSAQTIVCNVPAGNICGFTPIISPNGVINACQGSTVELSLNAGSYPASSTIQWNKDGVTIIGENYSNHHVNEDGYYTVTVFSPTGCPVVSDPVQVQYNLPANNTPTITSTGTSGPCGQINLTLTANGSFASYLWNNGQTGTTLNVTQAGVYSVIGQSGVGCNVTSAPFAVSTSTFSTPEICMVDVDSVTNQAIIVWEKPILNGITGFGIYKETSLYSENYQQIAVVPYDSLSEYIDINSDAGVVAERYRISVIDSCGGESSTSMPARVIGLKVLPGIGNQRVLTWNYYVSSAQNFTEYKIYSGASINQLNLLATVPAGINSNYIDNNPVNGINTVYRIYADMVIPCESTRALRNRSVSNGTGNFLLTYTNLKEQFNDTESNLDFKISPNPNNGIFNLIFNNELSKTRSTLQVFDLLGNKVYETTLVNNTNVPLNLTHLEIGIYSIRLVGNQQQANQRLLITK